MKSYALRICSYISTTLSIAILITSHTIHCMMPGQNFGQPPQISGMPSGPNFAPPQGNGGGMHMPSDAELEAMFREIEKIAAENPEIIKEWEREGQRAIMAMSDAELNEFSQLMGLDPAQLRAEAAQALAGESTPTESRPEQARPEQPSKKPGEKIEKPTVKVSKSDIDTVKRIIRELINDLIRLQQAANSVRDVYEVVRAWSQELRELMFYLRVIDSDNHYDKLANPEFKKLLKLLTSLQKELSSEISNIVLPDDLGCHNSAYDILGLAWPSSEQQINAAYEALVRKNDPKKLERELQQAGKSEDNIKRLVKAARINFEAVEEAYEQLSDAKLRKQLDRTIQTECQLQQQKIENALNALKAITASLSTALYSQQLLQELDRFLQHHAPQQAALKKQMEEAEKKRKEDQKRREGMRAQETPGRYEQNVSYGRPMQDYGYSDFPTRYSSNDWSSHRPDFNYGSREEQRKPETQLPGPQSQKPTDKSLEEKGKTSEKEERPKDSSSSSKEAAEKQAAQKKSEEVDKRPLGKILGDIEKNLKEFEKQYGTAMETTVSKNNLLDYETYAQDKGTEEAPAPLRPEISTNLKATEKALKLDALAKDFKNLDKKIKIEKTKKFDTNTEKIWKKIIELHKKQKKTLDKISKQVSKGYEAMTEEKQEAHGEAVEQFLSNLKIVNEAIANINKKFEE